MFRGTLTPLMMRRGMHTHLFENEIQLLDYKDYALATSEKVKATALAETRAAGLRWTPSPGPRGPVSKEGA